MNIKEIELYEPLMKAQNVSKVARSPSGFLTFFKKNNGALNDSWNVKRNAFIARHLAQYSKNPTPRRKLALIAWAYMP
jgi:hypothetical protein